MKRLVSALFVCLLLTVFLAVSASAGVVTQWKNITSGVSTVTFDKYSGTHALTSVVLTLTGSINGMVRVENKAECTQDITVYLSRSLTLKQGSTELVAVKPTFTKTYHCDYYDGTVDYLPTVTTNGSTGSGFTEVMPATTDSKSLTYTAGIDDLTPYISDGINTTFDLSIVRSTISSVMGDNDMDYWNSIAFTGEADLKYYYEETPEPGSIVALLVGLTGILGTGLRRRIK
ncbi:MAG: choice-of-anchor E domain-containing protein [Armatimonadota bacterium]